MESEPVWTSRAKSPLMEKFSSEEDQTHDAASNRTASQTQNQPNYSSPLIDTPRFTISDSV